MRNPTVIFLLIFLWHANLPAQGILFPEQGDAQQRPVLKTHTVDVTVENRVASFLVKQSFSPQTTSGQNYLFCFPLPRDAEVTSATLTVNGKNVEANVLPPDAANAFLSAFLRQHFSRRLLMFFDRPLLVAKSLALSGKKDCRITFEYSLLLSDDGGYVRMEYPSTVLQNSFNTARKDDTRVPNISVKIHTDNALKNIYSPTHAIVVHRVGNFDARVTLQKRQARQLHDFLLFYGLDNREIGLNVLTFQPNNDADGYVMALLSPDVKISRNKILPMNIVFVLDVSGSMQGEKLKQAKAALNYCINALRDTDHFNIITFSTQTNLFKKEFVSGRKSKRSAREFIHRIQASGGTNINEALLTALDMRGGGGQPSTVVFITDGQPTVGITGVEEIRTHVERLNRNRFTIYSFGIGYDVNTALLDGIAFDNAGLSDYIDPAEDIGAEISTFFDKIQNPVLSNLQLDFESAGIFDVFPKRIPDLHRNSQMIFIGRFRNVHDSMLKLTGRAYDGPKTIEFPVSFSSAHDYTFLPRLWATRKMGYLLARIKLDPENRSLLHQAVALNKQFGVLTIAPDFYRSDTGSTQKASVSENEIVFASRGDVGRRAVLYSKTSRKLKEAQSLFMYSSDSVAYLGDRTFVYNGNSWKDLEYSDGMPCLYVKYLSEAYFALLKNYPDAAKYLALGRQVTFKYRHQFVSIKDSGVEKISADRLRELFQRD